MCKNNFTNENEFDYWVLPDEVCNPCGSFNLGDTYNFYGPTIIIQ